MSHTLSPRLIETVVRKMLRDAKDSPERSLRNVVDLALHFSVSPAQERFFDTARQILRDEHSAYYSLVRDLLFHVDEERLVSFGMALGYNGCIAGSKTIRSLAEDGLRVPWFLTLDTGGRTDTYVEKAYQSLIQQGKQLGINTYALLPSGAPRAFLPLAEAHPDCAFVFFCQPEDITTAFLEEAEALPNLVPAISCREEAEDACQKLRDRQFLYALYYPYGTDIGPGPGEDLLCLAENFHAPLTLLLPQPGCPPTVRKQVYERMSALRCRQPCRTIPWDLLQDGQTVDRLVARDTVPVYFDSAGQLRSMADGQGLTTHTLFDQPLSSLLREAFPQG